MTAKQEAELKVLISKREHAFAAVNVIYDKAKGTHGSPSGTASFLLRVKRLDALKESFYELTDKINNLTVLINPEEMTDVQPLLAFDELYFAVLEIANMLGYDESSESPSRSTPAESDSKFYIKLPKIDLPKFSGQIENWPMFIDIYLPLVHNNKSLSEIEKFHYLVSTLTGPALSIAKNVPLTAANYSVVFDALRERYDNKRVLAATYLDKICKLKPMSSSSFDDLSRITNTLYECVNALNAMKLSNLSEFLLFYLASRSLDAETKQKFEEHHSSPNEMPTCDQLLKYLQNHLRILEVSKPSALPFVPKQNFNKTVTRPAPPPSSIGNQQFKRSFVVSNSESNQGCACCNQQHNIYKCNKLKSMDVHSRLRLITNLKLCFNCLRPSHSVESCYSKTNCFTCGKRHNTLLHIDENTNVSSVGGSSLNALVNDSVTSNPQASTLACANDHTLSAISTAPKILMKLLGSAMVRLRDRNGYTYEVRALIDSCSHECLMTVPCAKRIGLPIERVHSSVAGVGGKVVQDIQGVTFCSVLPRNTNSPQFDLNFIVMPRITLDIPAVPLPATVIQHFKHLYLADPSFDKSAPIDVLLGVDVFDMIYDGQRFTPGPGLPVALHSIYGWVITGRLTVRTSTDDPSTSLLVASTTALDNMLQKFWEVEEPPCKRISHPEDDICEEIYTKNTYREPDGRYVVPIMAKEEEFLGDSYRRSLNRFLTLEKRLTREPEVMKDYVKFMDEYENLGHMQSCTSDSSDTYIIPHHCIIRPSSVTTKLRVVFDASSKTSNNRSLNDIVHTGPKLQVDVVDIITKFRLHAVVFTADVCKMYRQIKIIPEDRHYQHILWREATDKPIQEYELNTVTYGVSSSPYLAIRTLRQLAKDHGDLFPRAAEVLCEETFMDDVTTGACSIEAAVQLRDDIINLLKLAQLELRKWSSNDMSILHDIPSEHCQLSKSFDEKEVSVKILGIKWDPKSDHFSYSVSDLDVSPSKRQILSVIARIFDPLGWISPVVFVAKLLMQELWQLHISWDELIPDNIAKRFRKFASQLKELKNICLPRHALPVDPIQCHLVGFCDGSSRGYGCCVYLVTYTGSQSRASLLIGKSKIAPLKTLTINRLELCGAVLLTRVLKHMHNLLQDKINIGTVTAYTDSTTVLAWINTEPCKLKIYVANRVVQIRESLDISAWRHVSTQENPADCCSRGISVADLSCHPLWWHGPTWLKLPPSEWPSRVNFQHDENIPEMKPEQNLMTTLLVTDAEDFIPSFTERFSSFSKMQRTLAWMLRFIKNSKLRATERTLCPLSINDLQEARWLILKGVQKAHFKDAFKCVQQKLSCLKSIQKLLPFIDSSGLLRVGGRLTNSHLPETAKHPILLPKSHLSNVIIDSFHKTYLHSGPRTLQSLIVREYWILGIRLSIRSRLSKCVTCFKAGPTSINPMMGNLPPVRIQPAPCFEAVGIDFGGPFLVKESKRRNARTYKVYICLFVCLAVKAIHLEVVTELSTEAFIAALDRFIARRGICKQILTDCGTNFVGAKRYLNEMFDLVRSNQSVITDYLANRSISWRFNPPGAPHFGGIFESGIRSTKYHLRRVVGSQLLTLEEMFTILCKIEAMLNSRPLCALSTSPSECDVLTPGHFLIGRPMVYLPEPALHDQSIPLRSRWQLIQRLTQHFWLLWQRDYLHTLQQRTKWSVPHDNLNIGDLVIINEPNLPATQWKLGRIIQTHPGKDNVVRVVSLKTSTGTFKRPVVKLCPLPKT